MSRLPTAIFGASLLFAALPALAQDDPGYRFPENLAGAYIADIQVGLAARGYYSGPVSGRINPATTVAIGAFQRDAGLRITGLADQEVDVMLHVQGGPTAPSPPAQLGYQPQFSYPPQFVARPSYPPPPTAFPPTPSSMLPSVALPPPPPAAPPPQVAALPPPPSNASPPAAPAPRYVAGLPETSGSPAAQATHAEEDADDPDAVGAEAVRGLQGVMASKGLYDGPIDGIAGPATIDAFHAYAAVTGSVSPPVTRSPWPTGYLVHHSADAVPSNSSGEPPPPLPAPRPKVAATPLVAPPGQATTTSPPHPKIADVPPPSIETPPVASPPADPPRRPGIRLYSSERAVGT